MRSRKPPKVYTAPPNAVFNAGRKKALLTIAIKNVRSLCGEYKNSHLDIALEHLLEYQKKQLEV